MPNSIRTLVEIHGERNALVVARTLLVVNVLEHLVVDALGVFNPTMGVGARKHLAAELRNLLNSVNRNVAGAVNNDILALERIAVRLQIFVNEVHQAIARGLGASERAAKREALAGKHAGPFVANALILAEHIGNFATTNAQVARRNVGVGTDVAAQFSHERLAEMHDFVVRLALGVEVGTAFAATHGKRGEAVLKNLLQAQELQHAERNRGVKAKAALVGANGGVELDAIAAIDLDLTRIIDPRNAEHHDALRLNKTLEQSVLFIFGMSIERRAKCAQDFRGCLNEFGLVGVLGLELFKDSFGVGHAILLYAILMRVGQGRRTSNASPLLMRLAYVARVS